MVAFFRLALGVLFFVVCPKHVNAYEDFELWLRYESSEGREVELNLVTADRREIEQWIFHFKWPRAEDVRDELDRAFYLNYQEVSRHVSLRKMRELNLQVILRVLSENPVIRSTAQVSGAWYEMGRQYPHWREQAIRLGPYLYFKDRIRFFNYHRGE